MVAWGDFQPDNATTDNAENRKRPLEADTNNTTMAIMDATAPSTTKGPKKLKEVTDMSAETGTLDTMEEDQPTNVLPQETPQQPTPDTQTRPTQTNTTAATKSANKQPKGKQSTAQQPHLNNKPLRTQSYKDILEANLEKYVRPTTTAAAVETILKQMRRVPADYQPNNSAEVKYTATVYTKKPGFKLPIKQLKQHLHTFKLNTSKLLNITYIGEHMVEFITPAAYQETLTQTLKEIFNWEVTRPPKTDETAQKVATQAQKRYQWILENSKDRALPQQTLDALRQLTRTATA
jgi:hypothetical protein